MTNDKTGNSWYLINDIDTIDSPALVIYQDRVLENISTLLSMIDDVRRLRPHVKTHKSKEATALLMRAGITKFKCATIAEAEMLALSLALDVLLAYQPAGPKLMRFIEIIKRYPSTKFSCLVDNIISAKNIGAEAKANNIVIPVFIDLNIGMNRTGITPGDEAIELYKACNNIPGIKMIGLHAYDGHIRNPDIQQRTIECDEAFEPVLQMQNTLLGDGFPEPIIVAGGSPTFPIHAKRKKIECSPGTFIYWDKGYLLTCKEQAFIPAALVISRIISLPSDTKLCLDLGHKSIASENALDNRVYFLNAPELKFIGQSEEHLIVEAPKDHSYKIGDVLYGFPYHICPTVALYERAPVIQNNIVSGEWKMISRDRKINL
ncbi:D-TA family PLP-dependent enzyme [Ginsengibacter hankyongi]|uniref:D-TA family PLP-dependent enzyme n=2 Tax=Ginsengibacter hankyongi TaxID=2607284 RepID=A0A5J5IQM5_9BACT|nr:D-TA family PLP-dependent enzyme [Ginsengibacter hankyongi]